MMRKRTTKRLDYHKTITNFPEIALIAFNCMYIFKEEEEDNENKSAAEQADHSEKVIS